MGDDLISGKGWAGDGDVLRFREDFPLLLGPEPTRKTQPVVLVQASTSGDHWIVRVSDLPQYPFSAIGFPRTKREALRIANRLKRASRKPISENPSLRDLTGL